MCDDVHIHTIHVHMAIIRELITCFFSFSLPLYSPPSPPTPTFHSLFSLLLLSLHPLSGPRRSTGLVQHRDVPKEGKVQTKESHHCSRSLSSTFPHAPPPFHTQFTLSLHLFPSRTFPTPSVTPHYYPTLSGCHKENCC